MLIDGYHIRPQCALNDTTLYDAKGAPNSCSDSTQQGTLGTHSAVHTYIAANRDCRSIDVIQHDVSSRENMEDQP